MNYITTLLAGDLINMIAFSMIFVFIILWYLLKHPITAFISLIPVFLGVIWISGTMGYLGIKLSTITVGLGAMLVGRGSITETHYDLSRSLSDLTTLIASLISAIRAFWNRFTYLHPEALLSMLIRWTLLPGTSR